MTFQFQNKEQIRANAGLLLSNKRIQGSLLKWLTWHKKQWNNAMWSNMDGCRDYHTKWRKSERERQILYDITYMWDLKYNRNEHTRKQKQTHKHREQTYGCQGGWRWERDGLRVEISIYKLIYIRWINNKVLLYSTGNYIWYPVINHNGKEYEQKRIWKEYIYIYVQMNYYAV